MIVNIKFADCKDAPINGVFPASGGENAKKDMIGIIKEKNGIQRLLHIF